MDFSHYGDDPVRMAVDLVNTINLVSGNDQLTTVPELRAFLDRYPDIERSKKLSPRDLEEVLELRKSLRAVFEANDSGAAADRLNRIIAASGATPVVSDHGGEPHLHYETAGSVGERLGAATAMGLATVLVDHGIDRFGLCRADDCVDAYVDTSRNRSRRHCSTTCSTREHVAAHRRRARSTAE